jgi:hypothetical protein
MVMKNEGTPEELAVIYSIVTALIFCLQILQLLYNLYKIPERCFESLAVNRETRWWIV